MNITEVIKSNLDKMTKSEYRVATYFLENPNDFAFETLDTIAEKMNMSTTSVIRFCRKNGFSGYKAFQEEVQCNFKYQLTLPDKFKIASKSVTHDNFFANHACNAISCIERTFNELQPSRIFQAADTIVNAERVFCFGLKESFSLAHYAYTRFLTVRNNVFMLTAGQCGEIESILSLKSGDICIFYLFHRYTKQSLQILKYIKKQGADVLLITSPPFDEVEKYSSILLPCYVDINGIKNSAAAPICVTDCLCNAVAAKNGTKTLQHMKESEYLFKNFTF